MIKHSFTWEYKLTLGILIEIRQDLTEEWVLKKEELTYEKF